MSNNTKLIRLEDGPLIEVQASVEETERIAGNRTAKKVKSTFAVISPILKHVATAFANTWQELNQEVSIEEAEVEIGLSFEGEGNLYITKSKAGANLNVKLLMRKKT